jgi:hypothetical protein
MPMTEEAEQLYYSNLWKIIHKKTTDFTFYRLNSKGMAELDSSMIAGYIMAHYPKAIRQSVSDTIYQIPNTPFSESISRLILNNSSKGFSIALKEKNGKHKIMVNAGIGSGQNKKRALVFYVDTVDTTSEVRNYIAQQVIKNDVEHILQKHLRLKSNKPLAAILSSTSKNAATPKGSFEKHFKALMKEQGVGASPMVTAQYLFTTMPYTEKKKLNVALNTMGIKSNEDMERLLHKWTAEAVKGIHQPAASTVKARRLEYER